LIKAQHFTWIVWCWTNWQADFISKRCRRLRETTHLILSPDDLVEQVDEIGRVKRRLQAAHLMEQAPQGLSTNRIWFIYSTK